MNKKQPVCPAKKLLLILGQPHVLTIIHTLNGGVWGFNQLQQVTQINSRTLTARLQTLVSEGIIESIECPKDARCRYYQLTASGKKISKVLAQLENI